MEGKMFKRELSISNVEITVEIKAETELAYLVSDGDLEMWIPKSQIEEFDRSGDIATFQIPEWLAEEKGLI